jgi:microcompartment protein CcmK/EutM
MQGAKLRCVEVVDDIDRLATEPLGGDTLIAWDLCGSGLGDLVALAEGPEATQPFHPDIKPLDASIVALLDDVSIRGN